MVYDVIIVGAGAAGLMTAITTANAGLGDKVLLLDGQKKVGAKILMSGGTRCNVTNKTITEKDYNSNSPRVVRNILRGFNNTAAIRFFQDLGVELVLEDTGKYFPITHSGKTVLAALLHKVQQLGVELKTECKACAMRYADGIFTVQGEGFQYQGRLVVLTTGGLSFPSTGSDGTGYRIAQSFGHPVLATVPALTPLLSGDKDFKALSGITLEVALTLYADGKKHMTCKDSFLFTHVGFSGPVVLDISRHWLYASSPALFANFIPLHTQETFDGALLDGHDQQPKLPLKAFLSQFMPVRLCEVLLKKADIEGGLMLGQLKKLDRRRLTHMCTHYPLEISGALGYSKAEVTAGGVDLASVNAKTLESAYQPGLYFAGEILDVDGRIGGFNFQWAWSSGVAAGSAVASRIKAFKSNQ